MKKIIYLTTIVLLTAAVIFSFVLDSAATELEEQLQTSVGEANSDSEFELQITAPESYQAGDVFEIVVSVKNITAESGIDFIDFEFHYDPTNIVITNDIDEGDMGSLVCFDSETLGGEWMNFSSANSNYDDLTPDDIRGGAQAVPANDGLVKASALTTTLYSDAVFDDDALYFTFSFEAKADASGDIGIYIPNSSVKAGANTSDSIVSFPGNGSYAIILYDDTPMDDSSDTSDDSSVDTSSESSSEDYSDDSSSDTSSDASSDTSSDVSEDISFDPETVEEMESAVGEKFDNSEFDIIINAPQKYRPGEDVEVEVSIRNISTQYGLDYFKFDFYYDETKMFLTNDLDESDYANLVCIDLSDLGKSWENFTIVSSNYKDLTPDDLRGGVQAVPTNDGLIQASVFTTNLYTSSVKADDAIKFTFNFKINDDANGDICLYIPHSSVKGALNVTDGLEYHIGNAGYYIMVENTEPEPPHECVGVGEWLYDETNHWKVCECGKIVHSAEHVGEGEWQHDEANHWKMCECGETVDTATHVGVGEWLHDEKNHWKLCECGEIVNSTEHVGEGEWQHDEANHWKVCECGEKANIEEHDEGEWEVVSEPQIEVPGEQELKCTACGYLIDTDIIDPLPKPENPTFEHMDFMIKLSEDSTHYIIVEYIGSSIEITIPDEFDGVPITTINSDAFNDCDFIVGIAIPESVSVIPENVFSDCTSLSKIYAFADEQGSEWAQNWLGDCSAVIIWGYDCFDAQAELDEIISVYNGLEESEYGDYELEVIASAFEIAKEFSPEANTIFEYVRLLDSLEFVFVDNPKLKDFGDINSDGFIDGIDYLLAKRICFFTFDADRNQIARANMDRNETIDNTDYMLIKRISFGTYVMV